MQRHKFLNDAAITAAALPAATQLEESKDKKVTPTAPIAKRTLRKTEELLSILGFGGIFVMDDCRSGSLNVVAETHD